MAVNSVPPHPHRRGLLSAPSWSEIPEELLWLILQRISDWSDLHQCLGVCPLWRSTGRLVMRRRIATPFLLLINPKQNQEPCKFLDSSTTAFSLKGRMELANYTIYNANRGWLLMHSNYNRQENSLYNPITREIVQLPPNGPFEILYRRGPQPPEEELDVLRMNKLAMSTSSPRDPTCVFFILYHHLNLLAFCKPASTSNSTFKVIKDTPYYLVDMIFYKGELYAVNSSSHLYVMKLLERDHHIVEQVHQVVRTEIRDTRKGKEREFYLVEEPVTKELLLVEKVKRFCWDSRQRKDIMITRTVSFRIFKLNYYSSYDQTAEWEEVRRFDSDHHALLLVSGDSMFVSTDVDDDQTCYKPDCIYFVDDFCNSDHPLNYVQVYDLRSHILEPSHFNPFYYNNNSPRLGSDEFCRWFRASTI